MGKDITINYFQAVHVAKVVTNLAPYATIQGAIDAITDNATGKRYAVYVHPGTYTEQITMEDYVDLIAAGGREETIITYTAPGADDPTVIGENAMIKGFTIISDGGTAVPRCVENSAIGEGGADGFEIDDCVLQINNTSGAPVALLATDGMDIRNSQVDVLAGSTTAVSLDTADQDYTIDNCKIGGGTTSLLVTNADNVYLTRCTLTNELEHNTCATQTIIRDCVLEAIDFDDGLLCELHHSYVETIDVAAGTVDAFGGTIRACTSAAGTRFVWWLNDEELTVLPNMLIAHALAVASDGDTIQLEAADYAEDSLTLVNGVTIRGIGHSDICSHITINSANNVFSAGAGVKTNLESLRITQAGAGACFAIRAADAVVHIDDCIIASTAGNSVTMTAGNFSGHTSTIDDGDINMSAAACTINLHRFSISSADIVTATVDIGHTLNLNSCDLNGGNITNIATGTTNITLVRISGITTLQDDGLLGTVSLSRCTLETADKNGTSPWTIVDSHIGTTLTNDGASGAMAIEGGYLAACGSSANSVVWYDPDDRHLRVLLGMKIAHALAIAAAGDMIILDTGTFTETGLNLVDDVNISGEGYQETIVTDAGGGTIFSAAAGVVSALSNFQIKETNSGVCLAMTGAGVSVFCRDMIFNSDTDAITQADGTLEMYGCHVDDGDIELSGAACTFTMNNCNLSGGNLNTLGAVNHQITLTYSDFNNNNFVNGATGATNITMRYVSNCALFTDAGQAGNVALWNCVFFTCTKTGTSSWLMYLVRTAALSNNNDTGNISAYGGFILSCGGSTGSIVWYHDDLHKMQVISGMKITHALAVVSANSTIFVGPGTYTEQITMEDYVDVIAVGGREETIITHTPTVDDQITVTGENAMIKGFTIVSNGTGGTYTTRCVSNAVDGFEIEGCVLAPTGSKAGSVTFIATASCDMRGCEVDTAAAAATAVSLDTDTENYALYDNLLGGATTSLLINDCLTTTITGGVLYNLFDHDDCATSTIARKVDFEEIDFDGGTLLRLDSCYVESIAANTGGSVVAYGGTIRLCNTKVTAASFVWWLDDDNLHVVENMLIADALTAASAGDTIHLDACRYSERITLVDGVHIEGATSTTDTPTEIYDNTNAAVITAGAVECSIRRVKVFQDDATATSYCVSVTGAAVLAFSHCNFDCDATYAIHMTNGNVALDECVVVDGGIDLGTAACTLTLDHSRITAGDLVTASTEDHDITALYTDFNGNNITNNADGATDIDLRYCSNIATFTDAGLLGTTAIDNSIILSATKSGTSPWTVRLARFGALSNTNGTGAITVYGGYIDSCADSTGNIYWWHDNGNELMVISGMKISDALTAASSGDVIKVGKGTFAESGLTAKSNVDIIGEGAGISVIDASDAGNPVFAIGDNISITIRGITIDNDAAGGAITISPVGNSSALVIEDCDVINAGVSDCVTVDIGGAGNGTLTARRTDLTSDGASSIVVLSLTAGGGLLFFNSDLCTFTTSGGATKAAIEASSTSVADVNVTRATFSGCTLAVYSTGANHLFDIDDSDFTTAGIELAGNVPVTSLQNCYDIGAFAHSVACTVTLYDCQFGNTYTIGAIAGIVNAYRTQFSTFTNGGSGAIAFAQCFGTNINNNDTSTMTIEGGHWDTVLQEAAAGIINIYGAIIATELDCGAAGAINAYNCEVTDVDCNGGTITVYGGDLIAVTDATGTVLWKTGPLRYEVLVNMKIQDSLTAGAGGEAIIHAGTHTPANPGAPAAALTVSANTLVSGEGKATIIQGAGAATNITNLLVLNGANITVKDIKLELLAGCGTAAAYPNVVYASTQSLLWLENLWLVGDTSVADDGSDARQNGIYFAAITESKIVNCRSEDNDRHGINLAGSSDNNTLTGNTSQGNTQHGILVDAGDNNTITANTSQGNSYNGTYVSGASTNNTITGNTIQVNTRHGIEIAAASVNNTVTGNTVSDNDAAGTTYHGIYIYASNENVVTGNQCDVNGLHGIYIFESDYCTVTGNGCHNQNTGDGINITGDGTHNADFNTVTGNVCTGNAANGVEVVGAGDANENIVVANNLKNNAAGMADAGVLTQTGHNIV